MIVKQGANNQRKLGTGVMYFLYFFSFLNPKFFYNKK